MGLEPTQRNCYRSLNPACLPFHHARKKKQMQGGSGIEPLYHGFAIHRMTTMLATPIKTEINNQKSAKFCLEVDSNYWPKAFQASALPLSYPDQIINPCLKGLEPSVSEFAIRRFIQIKLQARTRLTGAWWDSNPQPLQSQRISLPIELQAPKGERRVELRTYSLQNYCSTIELFTR